MKIPCVVLVYGEFDIVARCLEILTDNECLEIYTVWNTGYKDDDKIGDYLEAKLKKEEIVKIIKFEENISNNAIETVFKDGLIDLNSEFVIVTDGDLEPDEGWLDEHLGILRNCSEVFVVANSLKPDNLPRINFPGCESWIGIDRGVTQWYNESRTGMHLMTFNTVDFKRFLDYLFHNNLKFCDTSIHNFGYNVLFKKSARTKLTSSYHLTWDLYQDKNHPYTKMKLEKHNIWNHNKYCNYEVYE